MSERAGHLRRLGHLELPQQAAVIAEATAMQESSLINLAHGTSDSLGLFQQRPSQGWGTPAQIMQPVYASTRFYEALVQVPGWQSLPLTVAAQAVQGSATPAPTRKWQPLADALVATFTGTADDCLTDNGTGVPQSGTTQPARRVHPARRAPRRRSSPPSPMPSEQLGQALHLGRRRPCRLRLLRPGHDGLPEPPGSSSPGPRSSRSTRARRSTPSADLEPGDLLFTAWLRRHGH